MGAAMVSSLRRSAGCRQWCCRCCPGTLVWTRSKLPPVSVEGVVALAKIVYVAGARQIISLVAGIPIFERQDVPEGQPDPGINDPRFQVWLAQMRSKGLPTIDASCGTAHQMGTCRMATSQCAGVVDPTGKVFGTEGLYVADASVFPSATGANPMVTIMAISDWISRKLAAYMRGEAGTEIVSL